jgi:hypothetical protein
LIKPYVTGRVRCRHPHVPDARDGHGAALAVVGIEIGLTRIHPEPLPRHQKGRRALEARGPRQDELAAPGPAVRTGQEAEAILGKLNRHVVPLVEPAWGQIVLVAAALRCHTNVVAPAAARDDAHLAPIAGLPVEEQGGAPTHAGTGPDGARRANAVHAKRTLEVRVRVLGRRDLHEAFLERDGVAGRRIHDPAGVKGGSAETVAEDHALLLHTSRRRQDEDKGWKR